MVQTMLKKAMELLDKGDEFDGVDDYIDITDDETVGFTIN